MKVVNFDHNSTTSLSRSALVWVQDALGDFGNPSSIHTLGRAAKKTMRELRQNLAQRLNCHPLEIVFTSGATEANNTIIKSVYHELRTQVMTELISGQSLPALLEAADLRNEIITTAVEHPSVAHPLRALEAEKLLKIHWLKPRDDGQFDFAEFQKRLSPKTLLVSVMAANNETGIKHPIAEIAEAAKAVGARVHSDAVQLLGKESIDFKALGLDYISLSAHKMYALKGLGIMVLRKGAPFHPAFFGGAQERSRRPGTENILAMASLSGALADWEIEAKRIDYVAKLRDQLESRVLAEIPHAQVHFKNTMRIVNTSSLHFAGVDGETLMMALDLEGFAVSTGAACSSGRSEPSAVLMAYGLSREQAQSTLRISLGWETTATQVEDFVDVLKTTLQRLRSLRTTELPIDKGL